MDDAEEDSIRIVPDEIPSLVDGRVFDVVVYEDGARSRREPVVISESDPLVVEMVGHLRDVCTREADVEARFDRGFVPSRGYVDAGDTCGELGAREQQILLCIGHKLLSLSEAVMPQDFVVERGRVTLRGRRLVEEIPTRLAPATLTLPVQTAEGKASLALWATVAFQRAAMLGANLLDPRTCPDGSLRGTLPPYAAGEDPVPLAFVVASATTEAMQTTVEAGARGRTYVVAAAAEERGSDSSFRRSRRRFFRGPEHSLLAAGNVLTSIPARAFDSLPTSRIGDAPPPSGEHEVCDDPPASEETRRGMQLLRGTAASLRMTESEVASGLLESRVRGALVEDLPASFDNPETAAMSDEELFGTLGTSVAALRDARKRLDKQSRVLGRAHVTYEAVPGGVQRMRGTTTPRGPAPPPFEFARTAGDARIDHPQGPLHDPIVDYGTFDILTTHDGYGGGAVLETLDVVATAITDSVSRSDVQYHPATGTAFSEARDVLSAGTVFGRAHVPLRAQLCVGLPVDAEHVEDVRLRLYGADTTSLARYDLWIGEAGLQCATQGSVEGAPCDEADHRIDSSVFAVSSGADASGFGREHVEVTVDAADLPAPMARRTGVPVARFYVTEKSPSDTSIPAGSTRTVIGSFTASPGDGVSGWSRCTNLPFGSDVMKSLAAVVSASPDDCTDAVLTCSGVPYDQRVPLEDEITEALAGTGSDELETSFVHFLGRARQAAEQADALGQQLVQYGLEMDLRAEAAAEELEKLCGAPVNVAHIPGASSYDPCTTDGDCSEGYKCIGAVCQPQTPEAVAAASPESEGLAQCLGLASESAMVTLGQDRSCAWRYDNGNGIPCGGEIPVDLRAAAGCHDPSPSATDDAGCRCPFRAPDAGCPSSATAVVSDVLPLGWLSTEPDTPDECTLLARVASGQGTDRALQDLLQQAWMDHDTVRGLGKETYYDRGLLAFDRLHAHFGRWLSFGDVTEGAANVWPCAQRSDFDDCAVASPPLACGHTCTSYAQRLQARQTYRRALRGLQGLAGLDLGEVLYFETPGFTLTNHATDTAGVHGSVQTDATICGGDSACMAQLASASLVHFDYSLPFSLPIEGRTSAILVEDPSLLDGNSSFYPWVRARLAVNPASTYRWSTGMTTMELPDADFGVDIWGQDGFVDRTLKGIHSGALEPDTLVDADAYPHELRDSISTFSLAFQVFEPGIQCEEVIEAFDWWTCDFTGPSTRFDPPTYGDVTRGLELACWARYDAGVGVDCGSVEDLPPIESVDDLRLLDGYLRCLRERFESTAAGIVVADVPSAIVSQLEASSFGATYPEYSGSIGATVAEMRAEFESMSLGLTQIASVIDRFRQVLTLTRSAVQQHDLQIELLELQKLSERAETVGACTTSILSGIASAFTTFGLSVVAGASGCAQAAVALAHTLDQIAVSIEIQDEGIKAALVQATLALIEHAQSLEAAESQFIQSFARVNALLSQLDAQKNAASTEAAKVLFLDVDPVTGKEFPVNSVMRTRLNTTRIRYEEALTNAIRLSFIARRAIEQRLGVDLSQLTTDMTLVPAPATWADDVCGMGGIDYAKIRGELEGPIEDYADEFVGDYVDRLELLLQSYQVDHPFENGADVSVMSLRDDVHRVRETCDAESYNLFEWSTTPTDPTWLAECVPGFRCTATSPSNDAAFLHREDTNGQSLSRTLGVGTAFELASVCLDEDIDPVTGDCTAGPGGRLYQSLDLRAGEYLVSWYEAIDASLDPALDDCNGLVGLPYEQCVRTTCDPVAISANPTVELLIQGDPSSDPPAVLAAPAFLDPVGDPWIDSCRYRRAAARIDVPVTQLVDVGFRVATPMATVAMPVSTKWAAPQLEALSSAEAMLASIAPRAYWVTDDDRVGPFDLCPDHDGSKFRSGAYWSRGCEYVCAAGFGSCDPSITPERALLRCYQETSFDISQSRIERGETFPSGGFALGNFNYRHGTLAVNLVGTNVRDCAEAEVPSTCYASGFVPYSLHHDGPYPVRNHWGEDYPAPVFDGNIEHARALTAERYLTSPVSSADRALLTDYWRPELRGRPLTGAYTLRIYDAPGLQWSNLEDVQILLDYQYWTRFE